LYRFEQKDLQQMLYSVNLIKSIIEITDDQATASDRLRSHPVSPG